MRNSQLATEVWASPQMIRSNLALSTNVMLVPDSALDELRHLPGDFAHLEYSRDLLSRPALIEKHLSWEQQIECLQYLPCALCKKPCAGTCSRSSRAPCAFLSRRVIEACSWSVGSDVAFGMPCRR